MSGLKTFSTTFKPSVNDVYVVKYTSTIIALLMLLIGCDDDDTSTNNNNNASMTLQEFAHEFATFRCDRFWECCQERGGFLSDPNYATYDECYETLKAEYENGFNMGGVTENLDGLISYYETFQQVYDVSLTRIA